MQQAAVMLNSIKYFNRWTIETPAWPKFWCTFNDIHVVQDTYFKSHNNKRNRGHFSRVLNTLSPWTGVRSCRNVYLLDKTICYFNTSRQVLSSCSAFLSFALNSQTSFWGLDLLVYFKDRSCAMTTSYCAIDYPAARNNRKRCVVSQSILCRVYSLSLSLSRSDVVLTSVPCGLKRLLRRVRDASRIRDSREYNIVFTI